MKRPRRHTAAPMAHHCRTTFALALLCTVATHLPSVRSFAFVPLARPKSAVGAIDARTSHIHQGASITRLYAGEEPSDVGPKISESDAATLGIVGILASGVMLFSESVLFRTGCGLPAGPLGVVGAVEGISYLGVTALVGYSIFTKIRTGNGLPSGPGGILGAAEGLAYLAIFAGFWVLLAQVTNYGYIPNAVPMEGGMCS